MFFRLFVFITFFFSSISIAQIVVTNNPPNDTEEYLVNSVLCDDDLTTSNFSSVGFAQGIGYFDGFNSNLGFEEGVILSSGGIELVTNGFDGGSGVSGDSDLELALNEINLTWGVNNVTILEFDFVANSESVAFNYIFGSVEYTGYTCSVFNDIFGFFLSGPGIAGPYSNNAINLAYIPDPEGYATYEDWLNNNSGLYTNTPVAVNTVNSGTPSGFGDDDCEDIDPNWEDYNIFWVDNDYSGDGWQGVNEPPAPEFTIEGLTGFTKPLTAEYNGLQCGETYHIKLAIADASDGALNSVVFLEAGSFVSPSVLVNPLSNITGPIVEADPAAIYEGCAAAQLEFSATANAAEDIQLEIIFEGEAEYGTDYLVSYNGGAPLDICINNDGEESLCIIIPAGEELMYVDIQPIYDSNIEGSGGFDFETIDITCNAIAGLCQQAELAVSEITFNLYDQIEIFIDPGDPAVIECFGDEVVLEPSQVSGGYIGDTDDYTYEWYDTESGLQIGSESSLIVSTSADSEYQLIVYDDCQDQQITQNFNVEVTEYPPLEISYPDYFACDGDIVTIEPIIIGGSGDYSYVWEGSNPCECTSFNFDFEIENDENGDGVQYVEMSISDPCTNLIVDTLIPIELTNLDSPMVNIVQLGEQFCPGDPISLDAQTDGSSTYTYEWLNLNLNSSEEENYLNNIANISPLEDANYQVILTDQCDGDTSIFYIDIMVPFYEDPTFMVDDVVGCPGETVEISVVNLVSNGVQSDTDYTFEWNNGETTQSIIVEVPEEPTSYSVQVFDLCENASDIETAEVTLSVAPVPEFSFEQDGSEIIFNQVNEDLFAEFEWSFGDNSPTSYDAEPTYTYEQEGDYYVTLTAWDEFGCYNSSTNLINIYPTLLFYSPTIFSPNGDGDNDDFKVSVVGYNEFELIVFDRWGKRVFSTTNPEEGWDGKYSNGKDAPQDVYMYKAFLSNDGSNDKIEKGRVSIIK